MLVLCPSLFYLCVCISINYIKRVNALNNSSFGLFKRWAKIVRLGETKAKFKQCILLRKEIFNTKAIREREGSR
ncbi:hypothetical protein ACB092_07G094500 [Castanea dentata]